MSDTCSPDLRVDISSALVALGGKAKFLPVCRAGPPYEINVHVERREEDLFSGIDVREVRYTCLISLTELGMEIEENDVMELTASCGAIKKGTAFVFEAMEADNLYYQTWSVRKASC